VTVLLALLLLVRAAPRLPLNCRSRLHLAAPQLALAANLARTLRGRARDVAARTKLLWWQQLVVQLPLRQQLEWCPLGPHRPSWPTCLATRPAAPSLRRRARRRWPHKRLRRDRPLWRASCRDPQLRRRAQARARAYCWTRLQHRSLRSSPRATHLLWAVRLGLLVPCCLPLLQPLWLLPLHLLLSLALEVV
jgi:hypothetical protein